MKFFLPFRNRERPYREPGRLYLTAYAHLDSQWRWDPAVTVNEHLKLLLDEVFRLLEAYPAYRFNLTSMLRYALIREYWPEQYEQLKQMILARRWYPAGSALEETDVLIPSVESAVRNILYGRRFMQREFGRSSYDLILADSFGLPENFPTILAHCGMRGITAVLSPDDRKIDRPPTLSLWTGPDGSETILLLETRGYRPYLFNRLAPGLTLWSWKKRLASLSRRTGPARSGRLWISARSGTAPREAAVKHAVARLRGLDPFLRMESSDRLFTTLTRSECKQLPATDGSNLLSVRSTGSLTSQAIMKRWNSRTEHLALCAETAAAMAQWINGTPCPSGRLEQAWHRIIGCQQHDIITGNAYPPAAAAAANDLLIAASQLRSILEDAAESIAGRMAISAARSLLLFNPACTSRTSLVKAEIRNVEYASRLRVFDPDGTVLPIQVLDQRGSNATVLIAVPLAAVSWKLLSVEEKAALRLTSVPFPAAVRKTEEGLQLENQLYRIQITTTGEISSIFLKERNGKPGKEMLIEPISLVLQRERPSAYPASHMRWNQEGRGRKRKSETIVNQTGARILVTEQGPLRAAVSVEFKFGRTSRIIRTISIYSGGDEELIMIDDRISWQERGYSLRARIPLNIRNPFTTSNYETYRPLRERSAASLHEFPTRFWIDHSDQFHEYGLGAIVPDRYGFSLPEDDILRITLLFTPGLQSFTSPFRDQTTQDWGRHYIRYALYPHFGGFKEADIESASYLLTRPVHVFRPKTSRRNPPVDRPLPPELHLFSLSTRQASVTCCKIREDDDGRGALILRIKENWGEPLNSGEIRFNARILEAGEIDGLEQPIGPAAVSGQTLRFSLPKNGLASFAVRLAAFPGRRTVQPIPTVHMDFPRNIRLISTNGDAGAGSGPLLPRELLPAILEQGVITFAVPEGEELQGLACGGELLTIPDTAPGVRADTIYLLAAADEPVEAVFRFPEAPGNEVVLHIPAMTGLLGRSDTRIWEHPPLQPVDFTWKNRCVRVEPGSITRERLALCVSHLHGAGIDFPCYCGYLFRFRIDLPPEVGSIQLPRDARVKILAMTAAPDTLIVTDASIPGDSFDLT